MVLRDFCDCCFRHGYLGFGAKCQNGAWGPPQQGPVERLDLCSRSPRPPCPLAPCYGNINFQAGAGPNTICIGGINGKRGPMLHATTNFQEIARLVCLPQLRANSCCEMHPRFGAERGASCKTIPNNDRTRYPGRTRMYQSLGRAVRGRALAPSPPKGQDRWSPRGSRALAASLAIQHWLPAHGASPHHGHSCGTWDREDPDARRTHSIQPAVAIE